MVSDALKQNKISEKCSWIKCEEDAQYLKEVNMVLRKDESPLSPSHGLLERFFPFVSGFSSVPFLFYFPASVWDLLPNSLITFIVPRGIRRLPPRLVFHSTFSPQ